MEVLGVHRFLPANWLVQWLASEVPPLPTTALL
jgi:hypothetical protein